MAGVVIGIIGVLGKGEKVQKQTRTKTDTIEAASELEQEKGMPTGSDDEKVKTETTPKGTEEEVTAVTESPEKTETEDIAEPLEQAGKRGDDEKKTDEQTEQTVEEKAQNMMEHMSLEEKIYQLFVVTPEQLTGVSTVTMAGDTTRAALEAQPVGGIVFFAPNLLNREQTITMIQNMQSYSKTGLFIAVDEEGRKRNEDWEIILKWELPQFRLWNRSGIRRISVRLTGLEIRLEAKSRSLDLISILHQSPM